MFPIKEEIRKSLASIPPIQHNSALLNPFLKLQALLALDAGDERAAVFYSMQSLGASKRQQYSATFRECKDLDVLMENITTRLASDTEQPPLPVSDGYDSLCKLCRELPEQWTVLQISKAFNPRTRFLTYEENMTEPALIMLTLYRCSDPLGEDRSEPLLICLEPAVADPKQKYENFFEHISAIPREVRTSCEPGASAAGESQSTRNEAIEQLLSAAIERAKRWLGPWANLFCGKFRSQNDQSLEAEIYNRIEDYCIQRKLTKKAQRLISLVARRLDLLSGEDIYRLCCSDELDLDELQVESLYDYLTDMQEHKFKIDQTSPRESFPVVLIVDEWLDIFPWEMLHPTQESCRFGSFSQMIDLFDAHKDRIRNGYLWLPTEKCSSIINPDKNLAKMSTRLQLFYKEWYPESFELLIDEPPSGTELGEMLNTSDVVIYNGHGSGMQFLHGETLMQRNINCVTFLFGCDSVRLYSNGLFTEMCGSHLYYNAAHCPAVIGALWVLTDLYTDIYSMLLVGNWMPSTNPQYKKLNISAIDTLALKAGQWQLNKVSAKKYFIRQHRNLLKVMSECRQFTHLPQRIRCAFVCRGFPVMNETFSK
ncbi:hypothetical protein AND_008059 [Anopheles darlingi]|uniref:separase n=1 Tax=Anopheles darlingi TaxID=43151 RepID=W5JA70_ANODA|nr:hypothetical protein AND_008059 [Anopheles darlingi]